MTLPIIDPRGAHQRHIACEHCGSTSNHKPGVDCVRYICATCVELAMRPHGRSLRFPRDEQDEFLLTSSLP